MGTAIVVTLIAAILAAGAAHGEPPTVSNVTASQRTDASKLVDIYYDLSDSDSATVGVRVTVSNDGGNTYNIIPVTMTGDVGDVVPVTPTPTQKHIVWNAGEDMPYTFGQNFRVAVTADDCVGYAGEMITIPAGPFLMGNNGHEGYSNSNELPQHEVQMSEYQIGEYEVTRGEYRRFITAGGYENSAYWSAEGWAWRAANNRTQPDYWAPQQNWGSPPGTFMQTDRHPVVGVSYYEAEAFCNWATAALCCGGAPFHLPTEAQWEKVARWDAATSTPRTYPWGDAWDVSRCNNLGDTLFPQYQTAPVGSYINPSGASPYGCKDMAGNVWEWCKDWYGSAYYSQTPGGGWVDPSGPSSGIYRVLRGGCWLDSDINCRCAYRLNFTSNYATNYFGFRLAR
jgi:formylglycine-generating enzyme required for sulfatase activity